MDLRSYDRLFPSQDLLLGRGPGNLIAAPLHGRSRRNGATVFLDLSTLEPHEDQWDYLSTLNRPTPKQVATLARGELREPDVGARVKTHALPGRREPSHRQQPSSVSPWTVSLLGPCATDHALSTTSPTSSPNEASGPSYSRAGSGREPGKQHLRAWHRARRVRPSSSSRPATSSVKASTSRNWTRCSWRAPVSFKGRLVQYAVPVAFYVPIQASRQPRSTTTTTSKSPSSPPP